MGTAGPAVLAASLLLAGLLSGCIGAMEEYYGFDPDPEYRNPGVFPGNYSFGNGGSAVLRPGPLKALEPEVVYLRSTLPAYPSAGGQETSDGVVLIPLAIWRPDTAERVPVIVDAGPYYEIGEHCLRPAQDPCTAGFANDTIDYPGQTTSFSLKNFLPHGYAVVQLAVRGTGTHGGCMDLMGPSEVHDLDQAIMWIGEQPWSNGNVALWGVSYDGSTPWEVAGTGNSHLKTIVPVSGLPDIYDLMFHNGSAETRGAIMHSQVYWPFGFSDDFLQPDTPPSPVPLPAPEPDVFPGEANGREDYQDLQNLLCPEAARGAAMGPASAATGSRLTEAADYWSLRDHRDDVLANYQGSVFLVHGLQDWNVDPHSAIPFNAALRAKGLEVKEWYGQWDHALPDSLCARSTPPWVTLPCRLDFADVLLRWFERHLKDNTTVDTGPAVQVQDDLGFWRNADAFPPVSPAWTELHLTGDRALSMESGGARTEATLNPGTPAAAGDFIELRSEPFAEDLRVSGLVRLEVPFEAQGPGGALGAWLFDEDGEGRVRAPYVGVTPNRTWVPYGIPVVGHAQMNLRYHAGGETAQNLVPGESYVARMEFEPLDIVVPQGHRLVLWLFQGQYPDHQATQTPSPLKVFLGDGAVLRLPVVEADPKAVFPVPGSHFPDRALLERMHLEKPLAPPTAVAADVPAAPVPTAGCAWGGLSVPCEAIP